MKMERVKEKTTIGKRVRFYDKRNKKKIYYGRIIEEVSQISEDYKHFIQKIKWDDGKIGC